MTWKFRPLLLAQLLKILFKWALFDMTNVAPKKVDSLSEEDTAADSKKDKKPPSL